jgi:uncharacterized alpha-E superfamily protein
MLSRVANSLFWMSRYIERAENTARIVDVNLQLLLDSRHLNDQQLADYWMPIIQATGDDKLFQTLHPHATGDAVTEFLVFQAENTNSILSSIAQARENARMVRDQITVEMWEELNRLYLILRSPKARDTWEDSPFEFLQQVKASSLHLVGIVYATIVHNENWNFMQAGKYMERADQTTRILDVRHATVPPKGLPTSVSQTTALAWSAVLRSCSAWDAYKDLHGGDVTPVKVAEFLLLSDSFPRSVRFCVEELDRSLHDISGVPARRFSNDAEKLSGRLLAELEFGTIEEIFAHGLHDYLDLIQIKLGNISSSLFNTYIFQPFLNMEEEIMVQQEFQQQQARRILARPV